MSALDNLAIAVSCLTLAAMGPAAVRVAFDRLPPRWAAVATFVIVAGIALESAWFVEFLWRAVVAWRATR